ncbi:hypothetical protein CMV_017632 [Castanea mollissima]|uniref:Uncharacterized protein n=1 Tax=Castanea mollissima TaxID=60419 RepID=A0A8J4QXD9_9ROSI|nr:hypothetical protein CMV_017632 [Castanea mollissima]
MSLWELCRIILNALMTVVGRFGGGALRQEPPFSYNYAPTNSACINPQNNAIQAVSAKNCSFNQSNASVSTTQPRAAQPKPARQGNSESSPMTQYGANGGGCEKPKSMPGPVPRANAAQHPERQGHY